MFSNICSPSSAKHKALYNIYTFTIKEGRLTKACEHSQSSHACSATTHTFPLPSHMLKHACRMIARRYEHKLWWCSHWCKWINTQSSQQQLSLKIKTVKYCKTLGITTVSRSRGILMVSRTSAIIVRSGQTCSKDNAD